MFCIIFHCASRRLDSFVFHVNDIYMFRTSYFGTNSLHNLYSVAVFCVKIFTYNFTFCGPRIVIYCVIKTNKMPFSFLIYPFHVSNRVTIRLQGTVAVYSAYGIYGDSMYNI